MSNEPVAGCCPAVGVAALAVPQAVESAAMCKGDVTENHAPLHQHRRDLPALHIAATHLHRDFSDMFGVETIERVLNCCYEQLAARATVPNFLPLFAERVARQRLCALARVEG
jgi:arsenate reductase (thioredoxin)